MSRALVVMTAVLLARAMAAGAERAAAPEPAVATGYRVQVVVSGLPHVVDAIEPFRGVLLVSVGAPSPGGRLLRFSLPGDTSTPLSGRSGEALLSSLSRLSPVVTYHFTGRVYVGVPEQGHVLELPQVSFDLATFAQWEPQTVVVGLAAVRDLTFGPDSRLLVADGSRILETPVYYTPPMDAARLRTVYQCAGACQGMAVAADGDLLVLEAGEQAGRVVRRNAAGAVRVVAAGLPRPGEGLRLGPRGELYFTSEAGLLQLTPQGRVVRLLPGLTSRARVSLDPDANLLVADPDAGVVLRVSAATD